MKMRLYTAFLAVLPTVLAVLASTTTDDDRPCGFRIAPCPSGQTCVGTNPTCTRGQNCPGVCRDDPDSYPTRTETPRPTHTYVSCGGHRVSPVSCPKGEICIDDPYRGGCGQACDMPGICVEPVFCGGFAGLRCKDGKRCVDDPRDRCDPKHGGADCGGMCV
jgi:hypothetical protein